jgi:hypothetical protein
VHGDQEVLPLRQPEALKPPVAGDLRLVVVDDLLDGVAGDEDPLPLDSFGGEVLLAAVGVWHQHRARVVDDAAVHLFGDPVAVAAVAGLHVEGLNPEALGQDRHQAAVGFAEDKEALRSHLEQQRLDAGEDLADLLPNRGGANTQVVVGGLLPSSEKKRSLRRSEWFWSVCTSACSA